jgi:hypothetical protein
MAIPSAAGTRLTAAVETLEPRTLLSNYFVSTTGDDANPGTSAAPWRTMQRAANTVVAGDRVNVLPGNYVGFDLRRDGTAAAPITFAAQGTVTIDRPNSVTNQDGINLEGADWVVIDGFRVIGLPRAGIRSVTNHHVTIRNNVGDLNGRWGILTGFSDDLLIEHNVMSRAQAEHGIYVSNSGDRPVIRANAVFGNRANGIHMNGDASLGGDGIISGALVERNVIYDNGLGGGSGINCDGVQSSRFVNNLLYRGHAGGISLYRIDGGGPSTGNVVVNNTIVQASDGRWCINIRDGATGNTILNNILWNNHSFRGSISVTADSRAGLVSDYNAVMNRFSTDGGNTSITLAAWRSATGQDTHSFTATPAQLFVNAAMDDYHLSATSPAIDAGTSIQAPPIDLEGNARPSGGGIDIGAYERQAAQPAPAVASSSFEFLTAPQRLVFTFTQNVEPSLSTGDLVLENLTTQTTVPTANIALDYNAATNTATFTFPGYADGILPDGNYRATLPAASVSNGGGVPMASDYVLNFFFLQGDINHDGRVNLDDFNTLASNFGQTNQRFGDGDLNYDGVVNLTDFNLLASQFGKAL